jgi:hypothetical protein
MSTLKADTLVASDGTSPVTLTKQSAAKVWVHYVGGSAIQNSLSASSLTDNGAGRDQISFVSSFSDTNYAVAASSKDGGGYNDAMILGADANGTMTTSAYEFFHRNVATDGSGNPNAVSNGQASIHGDLA